MAKPKKKKSIFLECLYSHGQILLKMLIVGDNLQNCAEIRKILILPTNNVKINSYSLAIKNRDMNVWEVTKWKKLKFIFIMVGNNLSSF